MFGAETPMSLPAGLGLMDGNRHGTDLRLCPGDTLLPLFYSAESSLVSRISEWLAQSPTSPDPVLSQ